LRPWSYPGRIFGAAFLTLAVFGGGTLTSNYSSKITDDILRVGVNYRFVTASWAAG